MQKRVVIGQEEQRAYLSNFFFFFQVKTRQYGKVFTTEVKEHAGAGLLRYDLG